MYGLHGLKHHTVEISGDITDAEQKDKPSLQITSLTVPTSLASIAR